MDAIEAFLKKMKENDERLQKLEREVQALKENPKKVETQSQSLLNFSKERRNSLWIGLQFITASQIRILITSDEYYVMHAQESQKWLLQKLDKKDVHFALFVKIKTSMDSA